MEPAISNIQLTLLLSCHPIRWQISSERKYNETPEVSPVSLLNAAIVIASLSLSCLPPLPVFEIKEDREIDRILGQIRDCIDNRIIPLVRRFEEHWDSVKIYVVIIHDLEISAGNLGIFDPR